MQKVIKREGIYYDEKNNTVYTEKGRGHIVFEEQNKKEEKEEKEKTTKTDDYEIGD